MYYIIEYFSFQYKESQDEGGQVEEDGGHLFEGEREFHYEIISSFIQEVVGICRKCEISVCGLDGGQRRKTFCRFR